MLKFHALVESDVPHAALAMTFDAAIAGLAALPRLFIEPDGSFVWTGTESGESWQVDGNLIDRGDTLAYVELKGRCPAGRFDEVLRALGWPNSPLAFQLPRRGVTLSEAAFRTLAATASGAI